ncbi:MAG: hypothetical protein Q8940_18275, partial [Bacteroidota bacterium]|nr:hypothetical protein [Bacteroidota bacterium]
MKKIGLYGLAFLFIFACNLFAQTLKSDVWITNGAIYSIVQKGNITYLGGNFHQVGPYTGAASLISTTDAKPDLRFPKIEGAVTTVASDGNGGWFIGGEFMRVGGIFFMNLVHIKSDNTIDMSWMPNPNGEVTSLLFVNNILYVGGEFTNISGQQRGFAAAYDLNGQLLPWNPNANAAVNAIAVDGNVIYLGGDFAMVGGENRSHIAAVDVNGQLTSWDPGADLSVSSLAVSGNIVYAGGDFTFIGGQTRNYIAAIDQSGAATAWNPNPNKAVIALLAANNLLYVGGDFTNIGGRQRNYIAALDLNTG